MYNHILLKERHIKWIYGGYVCAEYPLSHLDSISDEGSINTTSALHLIVYGNEVWFYFLSSACCSPFVSLSSIIDHIYHVSISSCLLVLQSSHLEMVDGTILTLLQEKWRVYVRNRFYKGFLVFSTYYLISALAFYLRPTMSYILVQDDMQQVQVLDSLHAESVPVGRV